MDPFYVYYAFLGAAALLMLMYSYFKTRALERQMLLRVQYGVLPWLDVDDMAEVIVVRNNYGAWALTRSDDKIFDELLDTLFPDIRDDAPDAPWVAQRARRAARAAFENTRIPYTALAIPHGILREYGCLYLQNGVRRHITYTLLGE
jgi:hypothetical protein